MSAQVLCQSKSCPNGNPASRLECPTCSKSVIGSAYTDLLSHKTKYSNHKFLDWEFEARFIVDRSALRLIVSAFCSRP